MCNISSWVCFSSFFASLFPSWASSIWAGSRRVRVLQYILYVSRLLLNGSDAYNLWKVFELYSGRLNYNCFLADCILVGSVTPIPEIGLAFALWFRSPRVTPPQLLKVSLDIQRCPVGFHGFGVLRSLPRLAVLCVGLLDAFLLYLKFNVCFCSTSATNCYEFHEMVDVTSG